MISSHYTRIRALLRCHPDGLTTHQVTELLGIAQEPTTRRCLNAMPDVYIDRWELKTGSKKQYRPVWVLADVPEDCPHPTKKPKEKQHGD